MTEYRVGCATHPACGRVVVAALLLTLPLLACRAPSAPPARKRVNVAATPLPASAPVYVAQAKGYFAAEGLDASVQTMASGRLSLQAALEGKADLATVAETPIARSVLDGASPLVVATICDIDSGSVIVARKDRDIRAAIDLKGKRIGVLPGTSADFFQHIYLVTSGIDPATVVVVPLTADTLVSSLASGTVDAISAFAPYDTQAEEALGANAVVLEDPNVYTTTWNVAVRRTFAANERDAIVRFLRALERANGFIASHPAESQAITSKRTGIPVDALRRQWANNAWTMKLDQTLILSLEDEWVWMAGGKTSVPNFLQYIDTGPLTIVDPAAVTVTKPKD